MKYILFPVILLLLCSGRAAAYSVLTHEALIDINWDSVIVPLLKQKYPASTKADLDKARAFAYGGAIAPDMGYYPFGNGLFSDLIHYVRNGDFITALQEDASNVREYAFALGALSHYTADKYGHALGVNKAVPLMFPKLREEFGEVVTYEESPITHVRTEFGFDVLQTARGNYASDAYHRFISFEIADTLLKRSFKRNYGLEIDSLFTNFPRSVRTFRWAVKDIFPQLTKAAWRSKRSEIRKQHQTATARNFNYRMRRKAFVSAYGNEIERPGTGARAVAALLRILPKVGPLKPLKVILPSPEAEQLFIQSFDTVARHYKLALGKLRGSRGLSNVNFDTGDPSSLGSYKLADKTYYTFLMELRERNYAGLSPGLKAHIFRFYAQQDQPKAPTLKEDERKQVLEALEELKRVSVVPD